MTKFPYGPCECTGRAIKCQCGQTTPGPAAMEIRRDGKLMKVCTRCNLSDDERVRLLVQGSDNAKLWFDYDPLGAMVLSFDMKEGGETECQI